MSVKAKGERAALRSFEEMNRSVCGSAKELSATLQEMAKLLPDMVDDLLREVMSILWIELAGQGNPTTPIDTGRARTAWVLDTQESEWVPPLMKDSPKSPEEILAAVRQAIAKLPLSTVYFLYNNAPYILRLERGHSKQAPQGFIAIALANMAQELNRRATEFNQ